MIPVSLLVQIQATSGSLFVRNKPSVSDSVVITSLLNGTQVEVDMIENGWYRLIEGGWIVSTHVKILKDNTQPPTTAVTPAPIQVTPIVPEPIQTTNTNANIDYYEYTTPPEIDTEDAPSLLSENLNGIYGVPYQFMNSVDRKVGGTLYGRKYTERIVSKMPVMIISPGRVDFMRSFKNRERKNVIDYFTSGDTSVGLESIIDQEGKYYTFAYDETSYYNYVNGMLRTQAAFLGLENVFVNFGGYKSQLKSFDWEKAGQSQFQQSIGTNKSVAFYIDSENQVDESFNNNTTESMLANKVNSVSDLGRELNFLLGAGFNMTADLLDETQLKNTLDEIEEISNKYLGGNQILKDIASNFATVATGGKLLFPEIWSDSDFSKSCDVNIKLRSPDGDKLSIYMNILVPLAHLVALTAPRQADNPNGYKSPFLVRAFYKGLYNCDMGIISSLNISKGKEGSWTIDGLPTEVDVSMQIKDLYGLLSISTDNDVNGFMNNTALMDYLANSCGININEPDLGRVAKVYLMLNTNRVKDAPGEIWSSINQTFDNAVMSIYNNIGKILP